MKNKIKLSASKLDKFSSCSWLYYLTYVLRFSSPSNSGNVRGNTCHSVFDFLLKEKRKPLVDKILKEKNIEVSPALSRYVRRYLIKGGLTEYDHKGEHNYDLTNKMIVTGLSLDFYCEGAELEAAETEFNYDGGEYYLRGFIDKIANYPQKTVIHDYKSDAQAWKGSKKDFNIQSMIYSLWMMKERGIIPYVKFIFLRLKKSPILEKHYTREELEGFASYLCYITSFLKDFTFEKAISNFAASKGYVKDGGFEGLTMCGKSKYKGELKDDGVSLVYSCPEKWPYNYFAVFNEKGEHLYSSRDEPKLNEGETAIEQEYRGCPYFNRENYKEEMKNS